MKLRLIPVAITVVVSSAVLFGGWFMYQSVAMKDPFMKQVEQIEGVVNPVVEMGRDQVTVEVQLAQGASLRKVYQSIAEAGQSSLGKRPLTVVVEGVSSSETLETWWSEALFDVAQAMETRQYSLIPERLKQLAGDAVSIQVETEMDENNVYISIYEGEHSKYVILPRIAAVMGVWPNE